MFLLIGERADFDDIIPKTPFKIFDALHPFLEELATYSIFSGNRIVGLKNVDQLKKEEELQLVSLLNDQPPVSLYLFANALPSQSKLFKTKATILDRAKEKPWEKEKRVALRLQAKANQEGVFLGQREAIALFTAAGKDESLSLQELEKLITFAIDRKKITLDDIRALCSNDSQETIWNLCEAIFAKNQSKALNLAYSLLENGELPPFLGALRSQMKTGIAILSLLEKEGTEGVKTSFPYLKGNLYEKKISELQNYTLANLKRGFLLTFQAEIDSRNTMMPPHLLVDLLITRLC